MVKPKQKVAPAKSEEDLAEEALEAEELVAQEAAIQRASSWVGKLIKDAYPDDPRDPRRRFGQVQAIEVVDGVVRLAVHFADESAPRLVALEPHPDGHYLYPRDVKSRYRRLSELDVAELKRLAARRAA